MCVVLFDVQKAFDSMLHLPRWQISCGECTVIARKLPCNTAWYPPKKFISSSVENLSRLNSIRWIEVSYKLSTPLKHHYLLLITLVPVQPPPGHNQVVTTCNHWNCSRKQNFALWPRVCMVLFTRVPLSDCISSSSNINLVEDYIVHYTD